MHLDRLHEARRWIDRAIADLPPGDAALAAARQTSGDVHLRRRASGIDRHGRKSEREFCAVCRLPVARRNGERAALS